MSSNPCSMAPLPALLPGHGNAVDLQSRLVLGFLVLLVLVSALSLFVYPTYRRRRIDMRPFPSTWLAILRRRLPFFDGMPEPKQHQLQQLIKRFVHRKRFIGVAGLSITDEVRVTIAAQACLLLLNRPGSEYSQLRTILVYPREFLAEHVQQDAQGLVSHERHVLAGESWDNGRIVLAWDSVERGARNFSDGFNVVLHEFAHQLDQESGVANGAPLLHSKGAYAAWAQAFTDEFHSLQRAAATGNPSVFDYYGASDPAEFFAVATETFYERPHSLAQHHPDLFRQLSDYYQVDPRQWQRHR